MNETESFKIFGALIWKMFNGPPCPTALYFTTFTLQLSGKLG